MLALATCLSIMSTSTEPSFKVTCSRRKVLGWGVDGVEMTSSRQTRRANWEMAPRMCSVLRCLAQQTENQEARGAVWFSVAVCCSVLLLSVVCCSVLLQRVAEQRRIELRCRRPVVQCGHGAALCSVVQCWTELQCGAVCCGVLQCVAVCCSVLQCVARSCSVLQSNAGGQWCSVLQCGAVCCSVCCSVLQCVVVCCCVLLCAAVFCWMLQCGAMYYSALQCSSVRCSVVQCVVVCHSVLERVAACCSVVQ